MELEHSEAAQILRAHRIELSDEDPRSVTEIAQQFMLTGDVALKGAQTEIERVVWPVDL